MQRLSVLANSALESHIRPLRQTDLPQLLRLCQAHAAFEDCAFDPRGKIEAWRRYLLANDGEISCWVVEHKEALIGYASFVKQFSTWDARYYLYLDCLYLDSTSRGLGLGKQIMQRIKDYGRAHQCVEIQWQTPSANETAIRFYRALGAKSKSKARFFWDIA
ncbi:MAG: GNAT family N-acetyltransferase [Saprospiraceae bacterium]|nr:GNAT family N-acetyltransferase [Saprospiraceae bacterium]